jgi:ABC-type dipeptide/oligopeptide/nickel transport system permease subunit
MKILANKIKGRSLWAEAARRICNNNIALLSLVVIFFYLLTAILVWQGVLVSDWKMSIGDSRAEPTLAKGWKHLLGLDLFGYSIIAKAIAGVKTAVYVGFASSLISVVIGVAFGALSGYFGGWIDDVITYIYTVLSNIPEILLLIGVSYALPFGAGIDTVIIALGITSWVGMARIVRAEFIKHKNRDYVAAAAALGAGHGRRIWIHIFPNVLHLIIISFSLRFVTAIKSEVILTYLGLGAETGSASWGIMINDARGELMQGLWGSITAATVGMFFIILAFSMFADALRDAFDPKLRA